MDEKKRSRRTLTAALGCTLIVIALLFLAFLSGRRSTRTEAIVLPDAAASQEQQSAADALKVPAQAEQSELLQISRENALDVLKSLSAPSSYHRTVTVTIRSDAAELLQDTQIWVNRETARADITAPHETKHLLTDRKTLYLWYDAEEPVEIRLAGGISANDLAGLAEYETVFSLPEHAIESAELILMEEDSGTATVFLSAITGGTTQNYWISLDTGLLLRQEMIVSGKTVYRMEQTALEILADGDEAFSDVFRLPDGEEPFKAE